MDKVILGAIVIVFVAFNIFSVVVGADRLQGKLAQDITTFASK